MKKFLIYILLFFLPFLLIFIPYVVTDPFKVLYYYYDYYADNGNGYYINTNRSFVSTQMYIQNKDRYNYDSFIFGSSRSGYFLVEDWKDYLIDSVSCFHFDGYGESLFNTHKKLRYINGKSKIKNAIFCVEREFFIQDQQEYGHLWVLPPCLVEHNYANFHMAFIRAYLNPNFLYAYLDYLITGELKPYMFKNSIFEKPILGYKLQFNERNGSNRKIRKFSDDFYGDRLSIFPRRPEIPSYGVPVIKETQKQMLYEIHDILIHNNTQYKIILTPVYDQIMFAPEDKEFLVQLFGDNVIDFSGKNRITDEYHYYSDPSHFNEYIASELLRITYERDTMRQNYLLDSLYYIKRE